MVLQCPPTIFFWFYLVGSEKLPHALPLHFLREHQPPQKTRPFRTSLKTLSWDYSGALSTLVLCTTSGQCAYMNTTYI